MSLTRLAVTWDDTKRRLTLAITITVALVFAVASVGSSAPSPASNQLVSVIIHGAPGAQLNIENMVLGSGGRITQPLGILNGFAAMVPSRALPTLASSPSVVGLTPDQSVHFNSTSYSETTDGYSLYSVSRDDNVYGALKQGKVVNGPDLSFDSQAPNLAHLDSFGHGTHMAGIIAGEDPNWVPGDQTDFAGVAPGARIINVKVGASNGAVDISQIIAGIDWVVQHRHDNGMNIRVINLSLGTTTAESYVQDPLAFAAEAAWHAGIVVVAAAGNDGSSLGRLDSPATDPYVLAVGSDDTQGTTNFNSGKISTFSSVGATSRTPDLVAPGGHVQSLLVPGSYVAQTYASAGGVLSSRFIRGSGSSQAAAMISGAAAVLIGHNPSLTPDQVKYLLKDTSMTLAYGGSAQYQGVGLFNLTNAIATPAPTANLSTQKFLQALGTGPLEGARGDSHVTLGGVTLGGETDIFGQAWNSATMAAAETQGSTWSGGAWNGSTWSGSTWSGGTWSGSTWSGSTWSGGTWSGSTWSGSGWAGSTWSGSTWSGGTWSGSTWSGGTWSDHMWATASWS
jgi:serine protease AprX